MRRAATGLVLALGLTACVTASTVATDVLGPVVPVVPVPAPPAASPVIPPVLAPPSPSRAGAAVAATSAAARERDDVTLGVAVLDLTTGQTAINDEGGTPLRAASVAKLFTVVDILTRRAAGQVTMDDSDDNLIRRALGPSDDAAMNALWSEYGGSAGIQRVAGLVGLKDTTPPGDSSQWGEVETSARDVAALYGFVTGRLAPADRDFVISALSAAPATAADGFDQGYGLLDPARRGIAAAKQGWLCCLQSSIDLHSAGLPDPAGRYVLVLMSNQPFGYAAAREVLDDAASSARDALAAS